MASLIHKERECWNCNKRLKKTDDFIYVKKNVWTAKGISEKIIRHYCMECGEKKGLVE